MTSTLTRNLWRVHWYNDMDGNRVDVPEHVVLPRSSPGSTPDHRPVRRPLPDDHAHKVLAAYACLAPRSSRASSTRPSTAPIWPSTGNYARGGIAISRIMASRGVAILPGHEPGAVRLARQVVREPGDVIRTVGTESNVKEIYDACNRAGQGPEELHLNQFCEFGTTSALLRDRRALAHVFEDGTRRSPAATTCGWRVHLGHRVGRHDRRRRPQGGVRHEDRRGRGAGVPDDAENGFGEHNIQGIGDKHIPLIHNVMNTDVVVRDQRPGHRRAEVMFNSEAATELLRPPGVPTSHDPATLPALRRLLDLQRARRDQDGQGAGPRRRRRRRHGRDRRWRDVPLRARQDQGRATSAASSPPTGRRGRGAEHLANVPDGRNTLEMTEATGTASSTSATTRGSSSRAPRSSCSRPAATRSSGRTCTSTCPFGTP
jgi:hypothetical protein